MAAICERIKKVLRLNDKTIKTKEIPHNNLNIDKVIEMPSRRIDQPYKDVIRDYDLSLDINCSIKTVRSETEAFFSIKPEGRDSLICLNSRHPAYYYLSVVLESITDNEEISDKDEKIFRAQKAIKLLLLAWTQYEDGLPEGRLKEKAEEARKDWGRVARRLTNG
ncbi:MAG TPA: hypothetical protein DCS12_07590 [Clostridiales bacterium]|nr:hypothetical protein [Clostridiales bacterium]